MTAPSCCRNARCMYPNACAGSTTSFLLSPRQAPLAVSKTGTYIPRQSVRERERRRRTFRPIISTNGWEGPAPGLSAEAGRIPRATPAEELLRSVYT